MREETILVTGANGFIASHLIRRLAEKEGARVRGLVRRPDTAANSFAHSRVEYCTGDVTDERAVQAAAAGCDVIIHTAALQSFAPLPPRKEFTRVNVGGTENLLNAFALRGKGRFLMLGTINAHGLPPPASVGADSPLQHSGDRYSDSKIDAEYRARQIAREKGLPLTIIRPACTFGIGSYAWTLQPLARIRNRVPVLIGDGDGLCNPVYIDNLIDLIVAALDNEAATGEAFIGSDGAAVPWREFYGHYARFAGVPLRSIPATAARLASAASRLIEATTGRVGPLSPTSLAFYTHHTQFDVSKNNQLLGHRPRVSFEEGMERTIAWLRQDSPASNAKTTNRRN